jgi:hypothetical protein
MSAEMCTTASGAVRELIKEHPFEYSAVGAALVRSIDLSVVLALYSVIKLKFQREPMLLFSFMNLNP